MNVQYLYDISNNEILFKKELINIKQEIQNAVDSIEYVEKMKNNIEDYCELSSNFHSCAMNNNYELLTCNNYCIYILNQILKDGKTIYNYKMKNILFLKDQTEKDIEKEYLNYIFNMFEKGFKSRIYDTSNHINSDILETINIIFNNFNLDIIQELIELKPIIFIFSEQNHFALPLYCIMGYNTELFLDTNKKIDLQLLFSTMINVLTECILTRLFTFNLLDLDINILMKEYVFTNNFEIDRDELNELNIDYYLPIQRKKELTSDYYYDWDGKMRNYSKSWKSNTKCRKQWMKHLKD